MIKTTRRRGLSSIVGTLFFIVIMIAAFTALLAAFSYQNGLIESQKSIADLAVAKTQESFIVHSASSGSCSGETSETSCLELTLVNKGSNAVEISKIWVIEQDDAGGDGTPYDARAYDSTSGSPVPLDYNSLIVPIGSTKSITSLQIPINSAATDPNDYKIKVVSKLGTIVSVDFPEVGNGPPGPQGSEGTACWDLNEDGVKNLTFPDPPYAGGIFTDAEGNDWTTEDRDGSGTVTVLDCIGAPGSSDTLVLDADLLNKPEIFMIFPSPFGADNNNPGDHRGAWGVTVANPSEVDMTVNKIVITALPTITQSGQTIFPSSGTYNSWNFKGNQIFWYGTPVIIPSRSAQTFLASVTPSSTVPEDQNGLPIFANVQTSFGQFGKTSYLSSMIRPTSTNREPIVNVYRSDSSGSTQSIKGTWDLTGGNTFQTYITLAENSTATTSSYIKSSGSVTHVIINVPKTFTVVSATSSDFTIPPITPNPDGSTQIIATLNSGKDIGAGVPARSISLTVTAPDLAAQNPPVTSPKLFVMYLLADGEAASSDKSTWEIGPIDEVILKVTP